MALQEISSDLSILPVELQEEICNYLDGKSLLRACCVCRRWNRIISQLEIAWRRVCIKEGAGNILNECFTWKAQYLKYLHLLHHLQRGDALQYKYFKSECFCDGVDDFVYSNDVILAGINTEVRMWRISDLKPIGKFNVLKFITVMKMSDNENILAVGHRDGTISLWLVYFVPQCKRYTANMINLFLGHTSPILSISMDSKHDIICSGSSDQKVLVWQISSNLIITSLDFDGTLINVSFQSEEANTLLVILTSRSLYLYRNLHFAVFEFPIQGPAFTLRACIQAENIIYLSDGQKLMKINILTKEEIWNICFDCKAALLIAVGSKFGLITLWQRQQASQKLVIVDLVDGAIIALCSIPYCREHVIVGDTAWMDGLALIRPGSFLAAAWCMGVMQHFGQMSDVLHMLKWVEDIRQQQH